MFIQKETILGWGPLTLVMLNVNLVMLDELFRELERESNPGWLTGCWRCGPSVVWKTLWVLNSSTYNYGGVIPSIKKKTKQRKQNPSTNKV